RPARSNPFVWGRADGVSPACPRPAPLTGKAGLAARKKGPPTAAAGEPVRLGNSTSTVPGLPAGGGEGMPPPREEPGPPPGKGVPFKHPTRRAGVFWAGAGVQGAIFPGGSVVPFASPPRRRFFRLARLRAVGPPPPPQDPSRRSEQR